MPAIQSNGLSKRDDTAEVIDRIRNLEESLAGGWPFDSIDEVPLGVDEKAEMEKMMNKIAEQLRGQLDNKTPAGVETTPLQGHDWQEIIRKFDDASRSSENQHPRWKSMPDYDNWALTALHEEDGIETPRLELHNRHSGETEQYELRRIDNRPWYQTWPEYFQTTYMWRNWTPSDVFLSGLGLYVVGFIRDRLKAPKPPEKELLSYAGKMAGKLAAGAIGIHRRDIGRFRYTLHSQCRWLTFDTDTLGLPGVDMGAEVNGTMELLEEPFEGRPPMNLLHCFLMAALLVLGLCYFVQQRYIKRNNKRAFELVREAYDTKSQCYSDDVTDFENEVEIAVVSSV